MEHLAVCEPILFAWIHDIDWVHPHGEQRVDSGTSLPCGTWQLLTRGVSSIIVRHRKMLERELGLLPDVPLIRRTHLELLRPLLVGDYDPKVREKLHLHLERLSPTLGPRVLGQVAWIAPMLSALYEVPDCDCAHVPVEPCLLGMALTYSEAWNELWAGQIGG